MRRSALAALVLLFVAGCGQPSQQRDNVVIVLADALRADRLGCYGGPAGATPAIDELAERGVRYTRAYVHAPSTVPSVASLFTSTLPPVHRITAAPGQSAEDQLSVLPDAYVLLPEVFQSHGYHTVMVTTTGWITPQAGYDQGVDEYVITEREDRAVIDAAVELFRRPAEEPFFLYVHLLDLHDYYHSDRLFTDGEAPPQTVSPALRALEGRSPSAIYRTLRSEPERFTAEDARFLLAVYDRELRRNDRLIGELLAALEEAGLRERTWVVLTSDHGEQFLEHGHLVHGGDGFYEEVLRVPLILAGPQGARRGTDDVVTGLIDLAPTLLEAVGLEVPTELQGRGALAPAREARPVLATNGRTWKLVTERWSYIFSPRYDREELYDVARDPGETRDVLAEEPEEAARLRDLLAETLRESRRHAYLSAVPEVERVRMSDQVTRTLRSLGYLD